MCKGWPQSGWSLDHGGDPAAWGHGAWSLDPPRGQGVGMVTPCRMLDGDMRRMSDGWRTEGGRRADGWRTDDGRMTDG